MRSNIHRTDLTRRVLAALLFVVILMSMSGCGDGGGKKSSVEGKLTIVATTGMIADAAKNIVGDHAEVKALMGPGVDPHLYKATQGDLSLLTGASIVFYNGLHLEGKMVEALEKLGRSKKVVAVAGGVDTAKLRRPAEFQGSHDPHIWFDVKLWTGAVRKIAEEMKILDPSHAADYEKNAAAYIGRLDSLDAWVRAEIATIPRMQRVLVTAHDAFGYFGQAYDIEVRGLQGISTVSEFGLADITALVDMIAARKIKAVFVESSVPRRSIEAVAQGVRSKGHEVTIGGQLYSDAMGAEGTPDGTYLGMVTANVNTIVKALR
jgi:manganese/zinc/iron transport system substrate-binding protein